MEIHPRVENSCQEASPLLIITKLSVHEEDEVWLRRGDHCGGNTGLKFLDSLSSSGSHDKGSACPAKWVYERGRESLPRIMSHFPGGAHRINFGGNGHYYPDMVCVHLNICPIFPLLNHDHILHDGYLQPCLCFRGKQVLLLFFLLLYKEFVVLEGRRFIHQLGNFPVLGKRRQ